MISSYKVTPELEIITSPLFIPGYGIIPINAFVIKGSEPILVDTGIIAESEEFMSVLRSVIDPNELKWIWLTHVDADHIGSLHQLLNTYPQIRLLTTFRGFAMASFVGQIPIDRVKIVNQGESIDLGDRTLTAVKPPLFDNASSMGFFDSKTEALFTVDSFGAFLPDEYESAEAVSAKSLSEGQILWGTIDFPWIHRADQAKFQKDLNEILKMQPKTIISSHLAPAPASMIPQMLETLASFIDLPRFVDPGQKDLDILITQMTGGGAE